MLDVPVVSTRKAEFEGRLFGHCKFFSAYDWHASLFAAERAADSSPHVRAELRAGALPAVGRATEAAGACASASKRRRSASARTSTTRARGEGEGSVVRIWRYPLKGCVAVAGDTRRDGDEGRMRSYASLLPDRW